MPNSARGKTVLARSKLLGSSSYILGLGLVVLLVVVLAITVFSHDKPQKSVPSCGTYRVDKTVRISSETINAEVASTPAQRAKGLAGRPCILPNQGMLFDFGKSGSYAFWMKDMHFAIDIVWIGSDHKTVGLEKNVKPSTYPDRFVNKDKTALYVLELKANRAADLHITLGTPIQF